MDEFQPWSSIDYSAAVLLCMADDARNFIQLKLKHCSRSYNFYKLMLLT